MKRPEINHALIGELAARVEKLDWPDEIKEQLTWFWHHPDNASLREIDRSSREFHGPDYQKMCDFLMPNTSSDYSLADWLAALVYERPAAIEPARALIVAWKSSGSELPGPIANLAAALKSARPDGRGRPTKVGAYFGQTMIWQMVRVLLLLEQGSASRNRAQTRGDNAFRMVADVSGFKFDTVVEIYAAREKARKAGLTRLLGDDLEGCLIPD